MLGAAISRSGPPAIMSGEGKSGQQSYRSESVERNRKDSGFAESREEQSGVHVSKPCSKASMDESTMASDQTDTLEQRVSTEGQSHDTGRRDRPTAFPSHSSSREYQPSISTASRATSMHTHSLSRISTSSYRTPRPSLIHPASSFHRPPSVYNKARPPMSIRTSSAPSTHSPAKDPLTFHRNSCRLFQSGGTTVAYHQRLSGASTTEGLTDIINASRHGSIPARLTTTPTSDGLNSLSTEASPTEPTPPTIIDWTSTATRRREYEQIDRSHRGLRGWWRRAAPRWCHRSRSSRISFYDGDSDAGSVRRYRIPLADENDGSEDDGLKDMEKCLSSAKVREMGKRPSSVAASRQNSWSCFNFRDR